MADLRLSKIDSEETVSDGAIRENCRHISLMKTEHQNTAKLDVNSLYEQFKLDENANKYHFRLIYRVTHIAPSLRRRYDIVGLSLYNFWRASICFMRESMPDN